MAKLHFLMLNFAGITFFFFFNECILLLRNARVYCMFPASVRSALQLTGRPAAQSWQTADSNGIEDVIHIH